MTFGIQYVCVRSTTLHCNFTTFTLVKYLNTSPPAPPLGKVFIVECEDQSKRCIRVSLAQRLVINNQPIDQFCNRSQCIVSTQLNNSIWTRFPTSAVGLKKINMLVKDHRCVWWESPSPLKYWHNGRCSSVCRPTPKGCARALRAKCNVLFFFFFPNQSGLDCVCVCACVCMHH